MSLLFPERQTVFLGPERKLDAGRLSGRVTVVLSNHLVRYALVPWSSALGNAAEEEAYVRHHFARVHGERARSWAVRASPGSGDLRLCSAVDAELLESIRRAFDGSKAKLVSIQPALMAAFNRARRDIPRAGAWLVLAEAGRACVALYAGGWRAVQNARGAWEEVLERERLRAGGPLPEKVIQL